MSADHSPGDEHADFELTGPVFDPTGSRLDFASQRAVPVGLVYETSGPFRRIRIDRRVHRRLRRRDVARTRLIVATTDAAGKRRRNSKRVRLG